MLQEALNDNKQYFNHISGLKLYKLIIIIFRKMRMCNMQLWEM